MLLFPAIDLMSGEVVRLRQGLGDEKTVFPGQPAEWAARWQHEGGDWLHVVDLDAAFSGERANEEAIRAIRAAITIPLQLGGGMRSLPAIECALELGVDRVVIGTRAAESLAFVREAVETFGGAKIAIGIDARGGLVAVKGWTESSSRQALDLARDVAALGVGAIIYTDIATDGMMTGPNFAALDAMIAAVTTPVIASGGVSRPEDVAALAACPRLHGAIIGRALYDSAIDLSRIRPPRPHC